MKNAPDNLADIGLGLNRQNSEVLCADAAKEVRMRLGKLVNNRFFNSWFFFN